MSKKKSAAKKPQSKSRHSASTKANNSVDLSQLTLAQQRELLQQLNLEINKTKPSERWENIAKTDVYFPKGQPVQKAQPTYIPPTSQDDEKAEMLANVRRRQEQATDKMIADMPNRITQGKPWIYRPKDNTIEDTLTNPTIEQLIKEDNARKEEIAYLKAEIAKYKAVIPKSTISRAGTIHKSAGGRAGITVMTPSGSSLGDYQRAWNSDEC